MPVEIITVIPVEKCSSKKKKKERKVLFQGRHELGKRFIWLFLLNLHHLS